jgi:hypothetical protein
MPTVKSADLAEAARLARAVLDAVDRGEIEATTPRAVAMLRRIEGAAVAWETAAGSRN